MTSTFLALIVTLLMQGSLADYFAAQTDEICRTSLSNIRSIDDWRANREELRRQLLDMLGLWPLPLKQDLQVKVTGRAERPGFVVEKLHFESVPGLYVTANLYLPKALKSPAPAILYLCGHGRVVKDGIAYGSKANYQHHPAWFAENGYVALIIDTLDLGEIEGEHHGTYNRNMWWWPTRGYTPAGVETWNAIRALDLLESRSEVDRTRIGVTGRSGGGAYTWFLAGVDDRPAALVPVAGITDMKSHIVNGAIEGHCDCMYPVNIYGWDFTVLAALAAPRPLLLANSDKDAIFPLDGVLRIHEQLKRHYAMHEAADRLGLFISEGPHADTQELQVAAFRWMNRWLKKDVSPVLPPAYKRFEPQELKVFESLPADQVNTRAHEVFVRAAAPVAPSTREEWERTAAALRKSLEEKVFRNALHLPAGRRHTGVLTNAFDQPRTAFLQHDVELQDGSSVRFYTSRPPGGPKRLSVHVLPELPVPEQLERAFAFEIRDGTAVALVLPRSPAPGSADARRAAHNRRRFVLLGQSLEMLQVLDVRAAIRALKEAEYKDVPVTLTGRDEMAVVALFAAAFEPAVSELRLEHPPVSLAHGGSYPNLLRYMDLPQALALVLPRRIVVHGSDAAAWQWTSRVAEILGTSLEIRGAQ
jgi:dienelactone hydrolase